MVYDDEYFSKQMMYEDERYMYKTNVNIGGGTGSCLPRADFVILYRP